METTEKKAPEFKEIVRIKFKDTHWLRMLIIAILVTAPHFLKSFFPIPEPADSLEFWRIIPGLPWVYVLGLVVRGAVLIFLIWGIIKLATYED